MSQPSFFEQHGYVDLGRVGVSACNPHRIVCLGDGHQGYYIAKQYDTQSPWILVSEWLCADIASLLGLPIPARRIIPFNGRWLGFEYRSDAKSFELGMEQNIINLEVVAGMIAFDVWVCNRDRHRGNVLLQRPSDGMQRYTLSLIDHSHALIGDLPDITALQRFIARNNDPSCFIMLMPQQLRDTVRHLGEYTPWLMKIEAFDMEQLRASAERIPTEWIPDQKQLADLIEFLAQRASTVSSLIMDNPQLFVTQGEQGG